MRRRQLLLAGPAAAIAGCALPTKAVPARIVVVGGGFGGATAARYLKLWGGDIDVSLVERQPRFVSCPLSNLVLSGQAQLANLTRGYDGLTALGVKVIQGDVTDVDAAGRKIRLLGGAELPYDRLVLSPGVDFIFDDVPGLAAAIEGRRIAHAWKAGPQTMALRAQLLALADGGVVAISIPRAPYRCPPGPYERACLIAAWLRANRSRSKLLLLDANPEVQSKKALFEKAFKDLYAGVLEYRPNSELKEIAGTSTGVLARFEFEDIRADVLNIIPPQRSGDIARRAGLLDVNQRWAGVDWTSMESTARPGIHVLGDATFAAPAMPKSGHIANQQAKVAAAAIIELTQGRPVNPQPVMANTCYSFVSGDQAVHVASVHRYDAAEKTMKPVAGAGGLSAAASALEGRYALSWAENIWADSLAL